LKNGDAPETSASLKNRDEVKNVYPKNPEENKPWNLMIYISKNFR